MRKLDDVTGKQVADTFGSAILKEINEELSDEVYQKIEDDDLVHVYLKHIGLNDKIGVLLSAEFCFNGNQIIEIPEPPKNIWLKIDDVINEYRYSIVGKTILIRCNSENIKPCFKYSLDQVAEVLKNSLDCKNGTYSKTHYDIMFLD